MSETTPRTDSVDGVLPVGRARWVAIAGAMLVLLALPVAIVATTAAATVRDSDFYVDHLVEAGLFRKLDGEMIPEWVEARAIERFPNIEAPTVDEAADVASETLSRSWFVDRGTAVADAVVPWLDGRAEHFEARIPIRDRVLVASRNVNRRLPESEVLRVLYDYAIGRAADAIIVRKENEKRLPLGLTVARHTWTEALEAFASRAWVATVLADKVDVFANYLVGDAESIEIHIPLYERQEGLVQAIETVVEGSNVTAFLRDRILTPAIRERVDKKVLVAEAGLVLSEGEVANAFEAALSSEWVQEREEDIVHTVAEYLAGETDELVLEVPLDGLKDEALARLEGAIDNKLAAYFDTLPPCTNTEIAGYLLGSRPTVRCRPLALEFEQAKLLLGIDVEGQISEHLDAKVGDTWIHDEEKIRGFVDDSTWRLVQKARTLMREGLTLTEREFRDALLDERVGDRLGEARALAMTGWRVDDTDLREQLAKVSSSSVAGLDVLRSWLHAIRLALWPSVLLSLFGFGLVFWATGRKLLDDGEVGAGARQADGAVVGEAVGADEADRAGSDDAESTGAERHASGRRLRVRAAWAAVSASPPAALVLGLSVAIQYRLESVATGALEGMSDPGDTLALRYLAEVAPVALTGMIDTVVASLQLTSVLMLGAAAVGAGALWFEHRSRSQQGR